MISPPLKARSRRRSLWFVFWICIVLPPVSTCYAQIPESQSTVITLEVGKPIDCDINEMESQAYEIALRKGDLMSVLIKQPGRESLAKLLGPAGKQITEIDPVYGKEGKKVISYVAQMDGSHQLILQPPSKGAPVGPYEIELVELRAATENDLALQEARGLGTESVRLFRAGKYDDALSSAERSLEIRIKILGEDNYIVASSLNRLAACYSIKADYARVEPLYQKALKILGKILEPEHFKFGDLYNNLAAFYYNTGDYERAETFYRRGLEIREKTLGPEHTDVAASLNNLAGAFLEREMYDQAEPLYRRAIAIREKISGPEDSNLFYPLSNLADCYSLEGDYDKAEPLYQRAIAILEKKVGPYHPQFAYPLEGLARIHYLKGDYEGATTRYLRALGIREQALGANHPEVAGTLTKMAALYAAKGDVGDALKYQSRANEISEHNLALHLVIGSERQKQAYLAMQSKQTDQTISLHLQYAPGDPDACSLAVASILQLKGRALDAMSDSFAAMHRRSNPEDRVLFDRLKDTIARLAGLVISGPQKISPEDHQKQITELEERKEKLEAEISRNSTEFQAQTQPITVAAVQSAVPTEAALLEFASYRPFDPRARGNDHAYGNPRYAAYIIRHQGDVEGFELGETAEIDALISRFREALRDPLKKDVKDWARAVDEKIMQPIRAHLGDCTQLLISPDGALNLVPFAALADERGHYLVERYSFTYLTSGRDLLRLGVARVKRGAPEVIADPAFGEPELDYLARSEKRRRGPLRKRQSVTTGTDLSSVYFAPLRGTALEAHMIKGLFPDAVVLTGEQATEAALKQAAAPWILHIATHGFFLENQPGKVVDKRLSEGTNVRGLRADMKTENPLLRSGLALAGANLQKGKGGDDGILTALEASGLNLWGTRLVILSACDTGLGEVRNGDGVYGLRRALVLAGSETQVMSLWPVSDYATRDLMKSYYDGLMHGLGCGSALRQMQLKMMRRPTREHPFYWASFIQSGEWANLDGKR